MSRYTVNFINTLNNLVYLFDTALLVINFYLFNYIIILAANVGNHFAQQQMQAVSTTTQSQSHVQQQTPQQLIQTQSQSQSQPARVANQQTTNLPVQQHATMPVQVVTTPALFERQVPIQITLPGNASTGDGKPKILTIHVPASAIQSNYFN